MSMLNTTFDISVQSLNCWMVKVGTNAVSGWNIDSVAVGWLWVSIASASVAAPKGCSSGDVICEDVDQKGVLPPVDEIKTSSLHTLSDVIWMANSIEGSRERDAVIWGILSPSDLDMGHTSDTLTACAEADVDNTLPNLLLFCAVSNVSSSSFLLGSSIFLIATCNLKDSGVIGSFLFWEFSLTLVSESPWCHC